MLFYFQYAEELSPGGASPMVDNGALEGVDKVYGNHFGVVMKHLQLRHDLMK